MLRHKAFLPILLSAAALIAALIAFYHLNFFDEPVSDRFYDAAKQVTDPLQRWLLPKSSRLLTLLLHEGPKFFFIGVVIKCAAVAFFRREWARPMLLVALCIILTSVTVTTGKRIWPAYCPSKLQHYGGYAPDDYKSKPFPPNERRRADCYPASHPAGGFAFLILGALATTRRGRYRGYAIGLSLGLALSFIQLARGEHFLSHCIATALVAWWWSFALVRIWPPKTRADTAIEASV